MNGPLKEFWQYDPATDTWTRKADFGGGPRAYATGFAVGGKGYIGTGYEMYGGEMDDLWEYDPTTDKWTQKESMGTTGRYEALGLAIGDKGYIGMGNNSGTAHGESVPMSDFWQYTPTELATGINPINLSANLNLYPNPSNGKVRLTALTPGSSIRISDILGNTVFSTEAQASEQNLELPDLKNGIYMFSVAYNKEVSVRKLVIQK